MILFKDIISFAVDLMDIGIELANVYVNRSTP